MTYDCLNCEEEIYRLRHIFTDQIWDQLVVGT